MPFINMSCGQTFLSPSCLKRMGQQVTEPIYYPEYYQTEINTIGMLKRVYQTEHTTLITTGTGTYGIEMGMRSAFEPGEKVLVVDTGVFGAVATSILSIVGIDPVPVVVERGKAVDMGEVERVLAAHPDIKGLYAVHDETTTGVIQPIEELGALCREKGLIFAVDAISSISGVPLKTDEWGIDLCFGSAQKCMNGPQGIVTLAVSPRVYEKMARRKTPIDSLSLDLETWTRYHEVKVKGYLDWWKRGGKAPDFPSRAPHEVSPPATLVWGLQGALEDILAEGLDARLTRHHVAGVAVRRALGAMGLSIFAESEEIASDVVTVVPLPGGIDERELRAYLLANHHVALGNGEVAGTVRIGTMGITANEKYVLPVLAALADGLAHFGVKVDRAAGLDTAAGIFAEVIE